MNYNAIAILKGLSTTVEMTPHITIFSTEAQRAEKSLDYNSIAILKGLSTTVEMTPHVIVLPTDAQRA